MAQHVCPWWLGYFLASPVRRWIEKPEEIIAPYIREGMTVLEPGPGMGFFTIPMARMVGLSGRVIAVDVQERMLDGLRRRAAKAGVQSRIETRLAGPNSLEVQDLNGTVDFVLAFAVVHEMPSAETFFQQAVATLKPGGHVLFVEPAGHVNQKKLSKEVDAARVAGLEEVIRPLVKRSHAVLLRKNVT
jgi:2-polyprenyl-3-methyl-5-hydroxy-6-metoxy-1,4-benzoquinol methylase